jgi:hypothetical protein
MTARRTTAKFGETVRGQARARALASRLGELTGESIVLDREKQAVSWAFDVRRAAAPGQALIVAGAVGCKSIVLLEVDAPRAFTGMLLGKALVSSVSGALVEGAHVIPDPELYGGQVDLGAIPGGFRLASAKGLDDSGECVLAVPEGSPASIQGPVAKLVKSLTRLKRLKEIEAPAPIVQNEQDLVRKLVTRLKVAGWDQERDPLPADLHRLAARVLGNAWDL